MRFGLVFVYGCVAQDPVLPPELFLISMVASLLNVPAVVGEPMGVPLLVLFVATSLVISVYLKRKVFWA